MAVAARTRLGTLNSVGRLALIAWSPSALATWILWLGVALLVYRFGYRRSTPCIEPVPGASKADPDDDPVFIFKHGHFSCTADPHVGFWAFVCPGIRWAETASLAGVTHFWVAFAGYSVLSLLNYMNFCSFFVAAIGSIIGCGYLYAKAVDKLVPANNEDPQANMIVRMVVVTVALIYYLLAVLSLGSATFSLLWAPGLSEYMGMEGCFTWGVFTTAAMLLCRQKIRAMLGLEHHDLATCAGDWCFLFWCPWCAVAQEARVIHAAYKTSHPAVKGGPTEDLPSCTSDIMCLPIWQ